jgi:hypothetical protein
MESSKLQSPMRFSATLALDRGLSSSASQPPPFVCQRGPTVQRLTLHFLENDPSALNRPGNGRRSFPHPMQDAPLHRLSVSSVMELVDEMPCGHFRPVADLDDLGPAFRRNCGIEGRDIHAVDDTPDGSEGP